MLLPLMVTLYLGGVEVSQAVAIDRKVTLVARSLADLVAQATNVDQRRDHQHPRRRAPRSSSPYPTAKLKITVSSVKIDAQGVAKIVWSDTKNGTARTVGSTVTLPAALNTASTYADLGGGRILLHADDRLRDHRHDDAEGPDLHAAAPVGLRDARTAW